MGKNKKDKPPVYDENGKVTDEFIIDSVTESFKDLPYSKEDIISGSLDFLEQGSGKSEN